MMFLQPLALLALPLIAIPLIIHWLNHRRHKPMHWGAMNFLKQAQKHNRGMAKLRYWLLLTLRMLAIAAIIFVLSRPLQTGYLASWTGAPATTLIVLDLSPSMQSVQSSGQDSSIKRAIHQLDQLRRSSGQTGNRIVFTYPTDEPLVLPNDITLSQALTSTEHAATTDLPATVSAALKWANQNISGPIDLWICSDLRESDWQSESQRWQEIVEQLKSLPAVRLNLWADSDEALSTNNNATVTVDRVVRRQIDDRAELAFDLRIQQSSVDAASRTIPLTFEIAGARTTVEVELTGRDRVISGMVVPIDPQLESGFGVVSLPADGNLADNQYRFVFAKPVPVQAVVVADDDDVGKVLRLALERPTTDDAEVKTELLGPDQVGQIDWQNTAMVAWQSELPSGDVAMKLNQVIQRGGSVLFLPPSRMNQDKLTINQSVGEPRSESQASTGPFHASWGAWQQNPDESKPWQVIDWRSDSDLLRNTAAGQSIPVNEWSVQQFRSLMVKDAIPLAKLTDSANVLTRIATERGGLYFLATLPTGDYSNLVDEGISLYVLMQRALEASLTSIGNARHLIAGQDLPNDLSTWTRLDESEQTILDNQRALCSGVYQRDTKLIAINRPVTEDDPETINQETLQQLLSEVDFQLIQNSNNSERPLASEVWRWCAVLLIVCLLLEAWMTMPRANSAAEASITKAKSIANTPQPTLMQEIRV